MKHFVIAAFALSLLSFAPQDPKGKAAEPAARQEAFFATVKAGEIEKAFEALAKGSRFESNEASMEALQSETAKGIKLYGGVVGFENFGIVRQEKHQAFGMGLVCTDQLPLYFYFVWYRKSETTPWFLTSVWFNDQVKEYWQVRH